MKPPFEEALRIAHQIDDRVAQFYLLAGLGCGAAAAGQAILAAQLLGATENVRAEVGVTVNATLAPFLARAKQSATAALGQSKFEAEFTAGLRYSRDAAIELALGESTYIGVEPSRDRESALLGKREADVARLVADGLTNKQIGARLFISERTVETHVRNIMSKLGFNSRAQIAGWLASSNQ